MPATVPSDIAQHGRRIRSSNTSTMNVEPFFFVFCDSVDIACETTRSLSS